MANQNSNSFLAKFAKLPLATKIISLVCVVVIVAGSATAAVLLSSPETSGNISSGGTAKSSTQKVHSTPVFLTATPQPENEAMTLCLILWLRLLTRMR